MTQITIDIETYSPIDLARRGVYKYAEHPDFSILLFGYAVDDGEVKVVDLAKGEHIPDEILRALTNPLVTKWPSTPPLKESACPGIFGNTVRPISFPTESKETRLESIWIPWAGNAHRCWQHPSDFLFP